jgi:Tfp pilus assembly protein PilO
MTSTRLWLIGIVLVAVVLSALGWFAGIQPKLAESSAADKERSSVESTNAAHEQTLLVLRELDQKLPELEDELAELRVELPADTAVSTLLGQLNELAVQNSVGIESITAGTPLKFATPPVDPAASADPPAGEEGAPATDAPAAAVSPVIEGLVSIPVTVSVTGDAERLKSFIEGVQFGERLYLMTDLSIDLSGAGGTATLDGLVYVLPDTRPDEETQDEKPAE